MINEKRHHHHPPKRQALLSKPQTSQSPECMSLKRLIRFRGTVTKEFKQETIIIRKWRAGLAFSAFRPRQKVFQPEGRIKASLGYTRFASLWFRVHGLGLEYPNSRLAQGFSLQGVLLLLLLPLRLLRPRRRRLIFWLGREAAMSVSCACSALFTPNP